MWTTWKLENFFYFVVGCLWGSVAASEVTCCKVVFSNQSAAYNLNETPGANCSTRWTLNKRIIIDETGDQDHKIIQFFEQKKLILKSDESNVFYNLECPHSGVSLNLNCTDPCLPENDDNRAGLWHWTILAIAIAMCLPVFLVIMCICKKRKKITTPSQNINRENAGEGVAVTESEAML